MKKAVTIFSIFLLAIGAQGQNVEKAKKILDDLSAKTKTYTSVQATFSYTLENKADGLQETQDGTLITKKDKYHLSIGGQQVICDGKTIWTYLVDAGEVQITNVPSEEEKEEEEYISPATIFTLYETGFKYKFIKEEVVGGKTLQMINIFPVNPDDRSYHTIRLYIDKAKQQINKIKIMGKDGTVFTYAIKSFKANETIADSKFVFNKSAYPDLDIVDMR